MDNPFSGEDPLPEVRMPESGERMDAIRARWWASLLLLLGLWTVFSLILFPIVGLVTGTITGGVLGGPILGLAAAAAIGYRLDLLDPVDEARRGAPLWARLIAPIPVFVILWILFLPAVGPLFTSFLLIATVNTVLALAITAAGVWFLGLYGGLVDTVRGASPGARLAMLTLAGILAGLVSYTAIVVGLTMVPLALASFLPVAVLTGVGVAFLVGWEEDAYQTILGWHFSIRLATFVLLEVLLTFYLAVLLGGFVTDARFVYAISIVAGLLVLVPASIGVRTWRDAWASFLTLEEEHRILSLLPTFPIVAALTFGGIVFLTDSFEAAYIASPPVGIAALLALGYPMGLTQRIPAVVRARSLPERSGIFLASFALLSAYAYFGIALVVQGLGFSSRAVEIALVAGMLFGAGVLAALSWAFDLDRGMGEEFESYGAPAEAGVLVAVFVATLALVFLTLALTTGDFRLAFLVSVLVAAGLNYLIAHSTGLVESIRALVGQAPWYAELVILGAVFVGTGLYGMLALGLFFSNVPVALVVGVLVGTASVVFLSRDLAIGEDVMESAEEEGSARATVLLLAFLGGFLAGLYVAAAALSVAGSSLFGFPFFIALISGAGATVGLARARGWDDEVLGRLRSRTDKLKVTTILGLWLAVGVFTGFALTALPIGAADLGLGTSSSLPLTLALGAGLIVWIWLPALLFRAVQVQRGPAEATLETMDRSRAMASLGWGLLTFAIVLVVVLSVFDRPLLAVGASLAVGYLVALVISTRRRRETSEDA